MVLFCFFHPCALLCRGCQFQVNIFPRALHWRAVPPTSRWLTTLREICLGSEISPPETFESAPTFPQGHYSEVGGWRIYAHLDLNPTTSSADWRCMSVTQRRTPTSQSSITPWAGRGWASCKVLSALSISHTEVVFHSGPSPVSL